MNSSLQLCPASSLSERMLPPTKNVVRGQWQGETDHASFCSASTRKSWPPMMTMTPTQFLLQSYLFYNCLVEPKPSEGFFVQSMIHCLFTACSRLSAHSCSSLKAYSSHSLRALPLFQSQTLLLFQAQFQSPYLFQSHSSACSSSSHGLRARARSSSRHSF